MRYFWTSLVVFTVVMALTGKMAESGATRKLYGAQIINGSGTLTLPTSTDTVVGRATTDTLTNKDIDGGTASNTLRVTLPKNTNSNLTGLSRKQGTLVYDTTNNQVMFDDGSTLTALSATGAPAYWLGYHASDCTWAHSSGTSYADATSDDASCTFAEISNSGMGTVASSGAKSPGITFTPPRVGAYKISVNVDYVSHASINCYAVITDGSNVQIGGEAYSTGPGPFTLDAILVVGSIASKTVKLRFANAGGTCTFGQASNPLVSSLMWTVTELR